MERFLVTLAAAGTVAALLGTLATPVPVAAQREQRQKRQLPHYTVTDLGTLGGAIFSADADRGWIESASTLTDTHQHAFLQRGGVRTDLGVLGVGSSSLPGDIGSTTSLPTLGGGNGEVFGINDEGQAVGAAENGMSDTNCP